MADQSVVLNPGDTLTVTVEAAPAPEVIKDVVVENTDGTSETLGPEAPVAPTA